MNNDVEKYLTIEQVAQMLQLQPETIRNMARAQRIPAIKIGRLWRFRTDQINEWVRRHSLDSKTTPDVNKNRESTISQSKKSSQNALSSSLSASATGEKDDIIVA